MPVYNKLVRDLIPTIIENDNKQFTTKILNEAEYLIELNKKMHEELAEYESTITKEDAVEELADLLELIHAAANAHNSSFEEVESIRQQKAEKRGKFNKRIFLIDVQDD